MERIALAREYRVAEWLRDAYLELTLETPLNFEELRPAEPQSNSPDGSWEATSRDWETLARILYLQTNMAGPARADTPVVDDWGNRRCSKCDKNLSYSETCNCRVLAMVDEAFRGELEILKENTEHVEYPLPCKLPLSYFIL
jgi:hypothetical protein